jgi:hypothetical protein
LESGWLPPLNLNPARMLAVRFIQANNAAHNFKVAQLESVQAQLLDGECRRWPTNRASQHVNVIKCKFEPLSQISSYFTEIIVFVFFWVMLILSVPFLLLKFGLAVISNSLN